VKGKDLVLKKGLNNKPYIDDYPIYFNVSHDGEWVICAIDTLEVGVDIVQIASCNSQITRETFTDFELVNLNNISKENEKLDYIHQIWALKESYIKWLGVGLTISLKSFGFRVKENEVFFWQNNSNKSPYFERFSIPGYKIAACSERLQFDKEITILDIDVIESGLN
jgi:4'-phosphopantetheinyl transferase